jgi:hypothetical protein
MKKFFAAALTLALCPAPSPAQADSPSARQTRPQTPPAQPGRQTQPAAQRAPALSLDDYGVSFAAEPRLVAVMAALEAAGFEAAPNRQPSLFRARVRQDQAGLGEDLRARLRRFYELHRLKDAGATPAREAARYVSLAFALGPPPAFDAPARGDETYEAVADVLDFAPLVREFYRASGLEGRLPAYLAEHRAEGDRMRRPTAEMVRSVLDYLHTRPITAVIERAPAPRPAAKGGGGKKDERPAAGTRERERERRFVVVPDLLGAPGAINFRVIRDDYFVVVPAGLDPSTPEVRRAYLQYVIDPLVLRFNRDIALRRADVRALLDERARQSPGRALPDVFEAVTRSLVAAADARMTALARLEPLSAEARAELQRTPEAGRAALAQRVQARRAEIEEDMASELADSYERGAVLAFHFADQLRDLEAAGFDFADFISGMIGRVDAAREGRRPAEYAEARARSEARARARREAARSTPVDERAAARRAQLFSRLDEVSRVLRAGNYAEAETRLRLLLEEYKGEPRVLFALGQTWSAAAADATNEETRDERLGRALANYRLAVSAADREADRSLLSRAYVAAGRILAFLERAGEAAEMFDAAIALGEVADGAYRDAVEGRKKLQQP